MKTGSHVETRKDEMKGQSAVFPLIPPLKGLARCRLGMTSLSPIIWFIPGNMLQDLGGVIGVGGGRRIC